MVAGKGRNFRSSVLLIDLNRDRTEPVGYKVSLIQFQNGQPVAPASSNISTTDIFSNTNNSVCPDNCFRPVGMAFDKKGRLFVASDTTGEIYVIVREESSTGPSMTSSSAAASGTSTSSPTKNAKPTASTGAHAHVTGGSLLIFCFLLLIVHFL